MNPSASPDQSPIHLEISCQDVRELLDQGEPFLFIDCREPWERQIASIGGDLIPLGSLEEKLDWIREHTLGRLIVYCHHGRRSLLAARFLRQHGVQSAQSMAGGIERWRQVVDPSIPEY
ncbi:MAG TPA: rhodanese-like domain-containing protein [Pirellulaceae bacterium]|nr:rhodanese-like domain-containing protein [Pirellulaceae bacterium]